MSSDQDAVADVDDDAVDDEDGEDLYGDALLEYENFHYIQSLYL